MHRVADDNRAVSVRLSRVLGDIGVNHKMVLRRRRTYLLYEALETILLRVDDNNIIEYIFGSQSEGTTSPQIGSDIDILQCLNEVNVVQDLVEWHVGKINFLILKDQTTGPGYCRLQYLRSDVPLPLTELSITRDCIMDDSRRVLVKNTMISEILSTLPNFTGMEGPAACRDPGGGFISEDSIFSYPCVSWPYEARPWLVRRRGHWPPQNLIREAEKSGCLIVAKGQKFSPFQHLEWRISTSLTERMLMFSMNITQLQCYFALKVLIKTFITNRIGKCVSSYHCKTVIFHCIESTNPRLWTEGHLYDCIKHCLQQLHSYIDTGHLPNYFISEDNLIIERISPSQRSQIIEILNEMLKGRGEFLLSISIDEIGQRLQNSFNAVPAVHVKPPHKLCADICHLLAMCMYEKIANVVGWILHKHALTINKLRVVINTLIAMGCRGTQFQQSAARHLLPSLCSSLGSMIAASDISRGRHLSPAVTALFKYGEDSDAASSRLKLASILYCRGEFMKAASLLQDIEHRSGRSDVQHLCGCFDFPKTFPIAERFSKTSFQAYKEKHFHRNVSYCVRFVPSEMACVPPDVQYEMFRSFGEDVQYREQNDWWMDWSVIDSLPFLHYLQYLVYGQLGSYELQEEALFNLMTVSTEVNNLGHRETAFNLLGKCFEQENMFEEAYVCYARSLWIRPKNNAAKFHVTYLMYQLYRRSDPQST